MTIPRKLQINLNDTVYYHCIARCVRRAFLYGYDSESERNYDHRKAWVITQLQSLCSVFAIKVCAYAIMSNHYHLVLCVDRDVVKELSDEEVILRIKHINTLRMHGTFAKPKESKSQKIVTPENMAIYREKLTDISSFMGALNEYLARKANREDECKGRFWESRFKSMALLNDTAVLLCMAYVDLNPIKAGMANSLEESDFTSIQERIQNLQPENEIQKKCPNPGLKEHLGLFVTPNNTKAHIPSSWESYHQLIEWTQQQLSGKKASALSIETQAFLETLSIESDNWLAHTKFLEKNYSWAVGPFEKIKMMMQNKGLKWVKGMRKLMSSEGKRQVCSR